MSNDRPQPRDARPRAAMTAPPISAHEPQRTGAPGRARGGTPSPLIWGPDGTPERREPTPTREARFDTPVTTALTQLVARIFLPASAMVAMATLIKGYTDTGDGFSAGVILSLGVLIQFVSFGYQSTINRLRVLSYAAPMAYGGVLLALLVTFIPVLRGDPIMTHTPRPAEHVVHIGSIELLTAVLFDVAVFFLVFGFCVGAMGFIARTGTSSSLFGALVARPGDEPRPDDKRVLTLNEVVSPVLTEPIRSDGETK